MLKTEESKVKRNPCCEFPHASKIVVNCCELLYLLKTAAVRPYDVECILEGLWR